MELNFATDCGQPSIIGRATFLIEVVFPLVAWALMSGHFRREDKGAWRGTGLYLMALTPAAVGMVGTFVTLYAALEGKSLTGGGTASTSAAVAEALVPAFTGLGIAAGIVASAFIWIARLRGSSDQRSSLSGSWFLGFICAVVILMQGSAIVLGIQIAGPVRAAAATPKLLIAAAVGAFLLASITAASVRLAPRAELASRRTHCVVAGGLLFLLVAAAALTQAAFEHFKDVARGV